MFKLYEGHDNIQCREHVNVGLHSDLSDVSSAVSLWLMA